jgi:hypothetical protein
MARQQTPISDGIPLSPEWDLRIYQLKTTDPALGGTPNVQTGAGTLNIPLQQLGNRTEYLKTIADEVLAARGNQPNLNALLQSLINRIATLETALARFGGNAVLIEETGSNTQ